MEDTTDHVKLSTYITFLARKYEQNSNTIKLSCVLQVFIMVFLTINLGKWPGSKQFLPLEKFCLRLSARLILNSLISDAISTADFHESFCVFINRFCRVIDRRITSSISNMKRRNNKFEHCFRSLTVLTRSTTKCTANPVGKKLDRLAIEFEATAFKAAFCSLFFEVPSQPCQH